MFNLHEVKKRFGKVSESHKICPRLPARYYFAFYVFLTAPIVRNSHNLAGTYCSKKRPGPILKVFQYRTWSSVKRSVK